MSFRPFDYSTMRDYEEMQRIRKAITPETGATIQGAQHYDKIRDPKHYFHRLVYEKDGQIMGFGSYNETWWNKEPEEYEFFWATDPACQRQGIGAEFYELAMARLEADNKSWQAIIMETLDNREDAVQMALNRGFTRTHRYPRSDLKVAEFDPTPHKWSLAKADEHGYTIQPLTELMKTDPDHARKLWDLEFIFEQDEPSPEQPVKQPLEKFIDGYLKSPSFYPDGWMIATKGEHYAGWSAVFPNKNDKTLFHQGWTGTDRPDRRKGLATAMKLHTIEHVQKAGGRIIRTDNEETNPMYQINVRLGFRPIPAFVVYTKKREKISNT